jgi:hypothetical protein
MFVRQSMLGDVLKAISYRMRANTRADADSLGFSDFKWGTIKLTGVASGLWSTGRLKALSLKVVPETVYRLHSSSSEAVLDAETTTVERQLADTAVIKLE